MNYLLDTCVISELVARRPNAAVVDWLDSQDDHRLYLSAITIGEIQRGVSRLPNSQRKSELETWLRNELLVRFAERTAELHTPVMLRWGELVAALEDKGRPLPALDSLIAALALHYDFHLVTRNERDFEGTGVTIVNPWNLTPS